MGDFKRQINANRRLERPDNGVPQGTIIKIKKTESVSDLSNKISSEIVTPKFQL